MLLAIFVSSAYADSSVMDEIQAALECRKALDYKKPAIKAFLEAHKQGEIEGQYAFSPQGIKVFGLTPDEITISIDSSGDEGYGYASLYRNADIKRIIKNAKLKKQADLHRRETKIGRLELTKITVDGAERNLACVVPGANGVED